MKKFEKLIMSCIDHEISGTKIEKLVEVKKRFESEMLWEKVVLSKPYMQRRLEDWLRGLCSTVSIPFSDYEISRWYEKELKRPAKNDIEYRSWCDRYWPQAARTLYSMLYD